MKRKIILTAIVAFTMAFAQAQRLHNLYGFSWEVSFPSNDLVDKVSYNGGRLEYRHFMNENLSIGGALSWNNFSQYYPRSTYENADQTQAITTDTYRAIFNLPITVNGHYYFGEGAYFKPYVGLGLGTMYSDQEVYYNIFVTEDENWGFIARPEIGTLINFSTTSNVRMMLGAGYNYATNKNTSFNINNLSNFWVSVGIAFIN
jgi:outer membrane protein